GFVIGRRIGSRCAQPSAVTVLLVVALACLIMFGLGVAIGDDTAAPTFGNTRAQSEVIEGAIGFGALAVVALLGYRQGRESRVAEYMDYLLSILPPTTAKILVDLAYEEARKAGAAPQPADSPALPQLARAS